MRSRTEEEIAAMQARTLDALLFDHLVMEPVRQGVIHALTVPHVLAAWEKPEHEAFAPRTAWSLFNAYTALMRNRIPRLQIEGTLRLTEVFRDALAL